MPVTGPHGSHLELQPIHTVKLARMRTIWGKFLTFNVPEIECNKNIYVKMGTGSYNICTADLINLILSFGVAID